MAITNVILFLLNALLCFVSATAIHSLISRLRASNGALRYSWLALGAMVTGAGLWVCQFIGRLATGGLPAGELPAAGVFAGIAATITMVWCYSVLQIRRSARRTERRLITVFSTLLLTTLLMGFSGFTPGWFGLIFGAVVGSETGAGFNAVLLACLSLITLSVAASLRHRRHNLSASMILGGLFFATPLLAMPDISMLSSVVPNRQLALTSTTLGLLSVMFLSTLTAVVGLGGRWQLRALGAIQSQLETAGGEVGKVDRAALLRAENERATCLLQSMADAVVTTDGDGIVESLNPAAAELLRVDAVWAVGQRLSDIYNIVESKTAVNGLSAKRHNQVTRKLILRDGTALAVSESRSEICDGSGLHQGEILVFGDISQSLERAEALAKQARTDALTGLCNRTEFERAMKGAMARRASGQSRMSPVLLYVDLDQFKPVNDTAGHAAGDELLRQLATIMRSVVDAAPVAGTVGRLGGDEFGIVLESSRLPQAVELGEKLCRDIGDFCFAWRQHTFRVGASIGVVELNAGVRDPLLALQKADQACYLAKQRGRGCVEIFTADNSELQRLQQESQWLQRLQGAFEDDRFILLQEGIAPLYGAADGSQFEVLPYMIDEQGCLLPPTAFLPAAQRLGMAAEIDRWMFSGVLAFLAKTPEADARLCSVNVSVATLTDPDFVAWLELQLENYAVAGSRLCIDISESVAVSQLSDASAFMDSLVPLGCQFALDGFGTGMATFGYLKTLPLGFIKIDAAIVRDIGSDRLDRAIVAAISEISQVLGIEVIAEGVHDAVTVARLRSIGVEYIQGQIVGEPSPLTPKVTVVAGDAAMPVEPAMPVRFEKQLAS